MFGHCNCINRLYQNRCLGKWAWVLVKDDFLFCFSVGSFLCLIVSCITWKLRACPLIYWDRDLSGCIFACSGWSKNVASSIISLYNCWHVVLLIRNNGLVNWLFLGSICFPEFVFTCLSSQRSDPRMFHLSQLPEGSFFLNTVYCLVSRQGLNVFYPKSNCDLHVFFFSSFHWAYVVSGMLFEKVIARSRPELARLPSLDEAPVFNPTEEVFLDTPIFLSAWYFPSIASWTGTLPDAAFMKLNLMLGV